MTYDDPECATERLTPCSPSDWVQCDRCCRLICLRHDGLYEVAQSGELPYYKMDLLCHSCIEDGWERGELCRGENAQFINLR